MVHSVDSNILCSLNAVVLKWVIMPWFDINKVSGLTFMTWWVMSCVHWIYSSCDELVVLDSVNSSLCLCSRDRYFSWLRKTKRSFHHNSLSHSFTEQPLESRELDIHVQIQIQIQITICNAPYFARRIRGDVRNDLLLIVRLLCNSRINGAETTEWIELVWEWVYHWQEDTLF